MRRPDGYVLTSISVTPERNVFIYGYIHMYMYVPLSTDIHVYVPRSTVHLASNLPGHISYQQILLWRKPLPQQILLWRQLLKTLPRQILLSNALEALATADSTVSKALEALDTADAAVSKVLQTAETLIPAVSDPCCTFLTLVDKLARISNDPLSQ